MHELFGLAAGLMAVGAFFPYVRSILARKTKPERASWWIWTFLMVEAFAAQLAMGGAWALLLTGALLAGNIVVGTLSLRYGYGRFDTKDAASLLVAIAGLGLWKATKIPLAALVVVMAIDFLGQWLVLVKSWRAPYTENLLSWYLLTAASVAGVLSVWGKDVMTMIFPLYLVFANGLTAADIVYRRKTKTTRRSFSR